MGTTAQGETTQSSAVIPGEPSASWAGTQGCQRKCKNQIFHLEAKYIYRKNKPQHVKSVTVKQGDNCCLIHQVCVWNFFFFFLKEPDMGAIARKEVENYTKAKDRYQDALKELKSQRLKDHERQNR